MANTTWLLAVLVFIGALILYVATMCRTVFWWDTGELAANARWLGIPHRPGFPLYVLIGRVFSLSPFGDFFYRINFLSALSTSAALGVFATIWHGLLMQWWRPQKPWQTVVAVTAPIVAIAGTYTLWMQAVRAEVYAPTLLVCAIVLMLAKSAEDCTRSGHGRALRWLAATAFVAGLGAGLHNATFLSILPAVVVFFVMLGRRRSFGIGGWTTAAWLFILGLTVYLYLPIRSMADPPLNWGWTSTELSPGWGGIVGIDALDEVLATRFEQFFRTFSGCAQLLFDELEWGLTLLALVGVVALWRESHRWCLLGVLATLGNLAVTSVLVTHFDDTNPDIHGYLLPSLAMFGFFAAAGVASLMASFIHLYRLVPTASLRAALGFAGLGTLGMVSVAPYAVNGAYCNLSSHRLAYDYGTEATAGLEPNAVVFVAGTNLDFVLRGLQYCDGWRPDIRIIDCDLMPSAWYREWLFRRNPDLTEVDIPVDSNGLQLDSWAIALARVGAPVYWEFTETSMGLIKHLIPAGHFFAVSTDSVPVIDARMIKGQEEFERASRFYNSPKQIRRDFDAQRVYVSNLFRAGIFYESRGHFERARELFQRALTIHSDTGGRGPQGRSSGQGLSKLVR